MAMRGRGSRSAAPNSADLLVCFPSRAHLTLMPKAICSPVSASEANKTNIKKMRGRGGHGSPKLWGKAKAMGQEMDEPTSPKVTCAGQVRVRQRTAEGSCKNWQSVMEEIERMHKKGRSKKKPSWMEALGLKKDVMQFLTCLRSLRLDLSCFGSLPAGADITSDEDEDDEDQENHGEGSDHDESSETALSKWFMVLQENQDKGLMKHDDDDGEEEEEGEEAACVPPPNALLLMRCRSAPAKTWLEEKAKEQEEEEEENEHEEDDDEDEEGEEKEKERDNSVLMRYDTEYYKISSDIAKETWVVGGTRDVLSRSQSWKR